MTETGAHSALSGAIAMIFFRILASVSLVGQAIIVAIISFAGHLFLDIFPHGHTKKMWKELISSAVIIPVVLYLSFSRGKWNLLFLSCVSLFFGNVFDVATEAAERFKKRVGWTGIIARKIIEFNLWIHWFVRSDTFMAKYPVRKEKSVEFYKKKPVFSWKYGWYNLVPIFLAVLALFIVF